MYRKINILIITIIISTILFSMGGIAEEGLPIKFVKSSPAEFDFNWNKQKASIDIAVDRTIYLVYIEEYYSIDNKGNPKLYSGANYYEGIVTKGVLSFNFMRPNARYGQTYSLIKSSIIIDNNTVIEKWTNSNTVIKKIDDRSLKHYENSRNVSKFNKLPENIPRNENIGTRNVDIGNIENVPTDTESNMKKLSIIPMVIIISTILIFTKSKMLKSKMRLKSVNKNTKK